MPQIHVTRKRVEELKLLKLLFGYRSYDDIIAEAIELLKYVLTIDERNFSEFQKFIDDLMDKHNLQKKNWRLIL